MNNWIKTFFNMARKQNMLNIFGRKRKNRGIFWTSLLGLGMSAAAFGLGKNRNPNTTQSQSIQNILNNFKKQNGSPTSNMSTLMEASQEILSGQTTNK
ncbi:hypothetical protein J2S13_000391 [Oikeobacillus pervagus]|uniref:Uncharacterized protein n=1 Tax=Oikeobacillus pervagus TaxID=1325931 RepID=A0AAJ1T2C6_9BACI|nr:hypothetical protein [Oikeobacillus pervagus]